MMIQEEDHQRLERLKRRLGAKSKAQVLRSALDALEAQTERADRIEKWKKAARLVAEQGDEMDVLEGFRKNSLLRAAESKK